MKNRRVALPMLLACISAFLPGEVAAQAIAEPAWPGWRGPQGEGVSSETDRNFTAPSGGPRILWQRDVGTGYSSVAIQNGRLYTLGSFKSTCQCLDAATGETIWSQHLASVAEPDSTPAVDGDRVYALTSNGRLVCMDASDGTIRWKKALLDDFDITDIPNGGWAASPVVEGDLLLINANVAALAVDKRTGALRWRIDDAQPERSWGSYATPVIRDLRGVRTALFLGPTTLNAVEVRTGRKLWSYRHKEPMHLVADPLVRGDQVLLQLTERCVLLDAAGKTPREVWNAPSLDTCMPAAVRVDDALYGTHLPERYFGVFTWGQLAHDDWPLRCVDWKTGAVRWQKELKHATLTAAGNRLLVLELDGTLRIVEASAASYHELSRVDVLSGAEKPRVFATPPVLCGGRIYCRNYTGELICIDVSS